MVKTHLKQPRKELKKKLALFAEWDLQVTF